MTIDLSSITQLITAVTSLGALLMSIYNEKKIQEVHLLINSRVDQLILSTSEVAHSLGMKEERDKNI